MYIVALFKKAKKKSWWKGGGAPIISLVFSLLFWWLVHDSLTSFELGLRGRVLYRFENPVQYWFAILLGWLILTVGLFQFYVDYVENLKSELNGSDINKLKPNVLMVTVFCLVTVSAHLMYLGSRSGWDESDVIGEIESYNRATKYANVVVADSEQVSLRISGRRKNQSHLNNGSPILLKKLKDRSTGEVEYHLKKLGSHN